MHLVDDSFGPKCPGHPGVAQPGSGIGRRPWKLGLRQQKSFIGSLFSHVDKVRWNAKVMRGWSESESGPKDAEINSASSSSYPLRIPPMGRLHSFMQLQMLSLVGTLYRPLFLRKTMCP
ncbi:hypothetical protein CEXT_664231 [Caerostris extrusa]|uniref:Uncharacterized protein n=1 Tax=Caerostris extrusa TaxID=172846 RepID=A0AAV4SHX0_CAEEX|nr:hypothetical protein CEXT_664231 [Caerostris extrusa]